jgi:hypothetical protein
MNACSTGKLRYETGRAASLAHRGVRGTRRQTHPYRCDECRGWHLGRGTGHLARRRRDLDRRLEQVIERQPGINPEQAAGLLGVSAWEATASAHRLLLAGRVGPVEEPDS